MKFAFVVQGEGRGHLTQAMTMEKLLRAQGHEVVAILVGKSKNREIPPFFEKGVSAPVHTYESVNFVNSPDGKHPDLFKTALVNICCFYKFLPSVGKIRKVVKQSGAEVIVNFYEMLGTVAHIFMSRKVKMAVVAHQFLFLHPEMKLPKKGFEGLSSLKLLTKLIAIGSSRILALSFRPMPDEGKMKVVPPLLRPEVLNLRAHDDGYILGYMLNAGFAEEVSKWHEAHRETPLRFFWDDRSHGEVYHVDDSLTFHYINDRVFLEQMAGCHAYAATAGFESICEAMYLAKPVMMVPSHIEQRCNAYDATRYSAAVSAGQFDLSVLKEFADNGFKPDEAFPDWARSAAKVFAEELSRL